MLIKIMLLLADVFAIVCLARLGMQWGHLPHAHPLARFCGQTTDWLVVPLRKIVPPLKRWDGACVLAPILVYYLLFTIILLFALPERIGAKAMAANAFFTLLYFAKAVAYVLLCGLVLRMVLSFTKPYSELLSVLHRIFMPLTQIFSFLKVGRYDFSGSVLALLLWFFISRFLPAWVSQLNLWLLR